MASSNTPRHPPQQLTQHLRAASTAASTAACAALLVALTATSAPACLLSRAAALEQPPWAHF